MAGPPPTPRQLLRDSYCMPVTRAIMRRPSRAPRGAVAWAGQAPVPGGATAGASGWDPGLSAAAPAMAVSAADRAPAESARVAAAPAGWARVLVALLACPRVYPRGGISNSPAQLAQTCRSDQVGVLVVPRIDHEIDDGSPDLLRGADRAGPALFTTFGLPATCVRPTG